MKQRNPLSTALCVPRPATQKGAVLFFTLIALVAMTLAALAMVRSVETGNLVAGNIALKQGAIQEADKIMNTAFACLDSGGALYLAGDLRNNVSTCNYYSSLQADIDKPYGMPDVLETITGTANPATGNTSTYVIERMCKLAGSIYTKVNAGQSCVESPIDVKDPMNPMALPAKQAMYRISVKISGPRNVAAYSQMIMNGGIGSNN